ncbi:MAG: BA14K family protein, partial [Microvirga sp.]
MRGLILAVSGACMLAAVPASAGATERPRSSPDVHQAYPGEAYAQYYRRGYGYYGGGPYYYRRDNGAAVAAGVAGLAAGALIAGAIANQAQA